MSDDVWTAFVHELAADPDLVGRLLDDHTATPQGLCRMHHAEPQRHPCARRQLALLTRAEMQVPDSVDAAHTQTLRADEPTGATSESERVGEVLRVALSKCAGAEGDHTQAGRGGLWVAYQVMVDLDTQRIVGVEALARLADEQDQAVSPDVFIPIAERTGLIASLGRLVLAIACADLAGWHARYPEWGHLGVSVNVSAHQAELDDLVLDVQQSLRAAGLGAESLTLELTESVELTRSHAAVVALDELHGLGVRITIDDVGTGFASLSQLRVLPVTGLKVDRSFTAGLPRDAVAVAIVQAVTTLARDLDLTCVVEGIETAAQLAALPAGVVGQGYLLGRPATAAMIGARLAVADVAGIQRVRPSSS